MTKLQIDIISDVMCPWCIIGYKGLEAALQQLKPEIDAEISWLPFELNPQMPHEGQNVREHIMQKYGISAQQSAQNREMMVQRGKDVGFDFGFSDNMRMINSFDLHRLLTWAKEHHKQHELQMALFTAHFTECQPLNDNAVLLKIINAVGLDQEKAKEILSSDAYAEQVRSEENASLEKGINSVPTFIINNKYSLSGGQPTETFVQALSQIASEAGKPTSS